MLKQIVKGLSYANKLFNKGKRMAKMLLNVCIAGAIATASIISELIDSKEEVTLTLVPDLEEPP